MIGLSLRVNRAAAKAGLAPGELRRVLQIALTADGALDVQRFLSASESIGLTTDAALIVLRELAGSPSFSLTTSGVLDAATFDPLSLFASGEEGAWYEPSTTTCFTDTAGTVAATYGDGVAYIQDLSGNGNHATQVTAGARPILARVPPRGRVNELSETDTLATQSVTVTAAQRTLSFKGTGTVTLPGASTAGPLVGTGAEDRVSLTFTPSSGTLTLTVLGAVTDAQLELGSAVTNYQFVADLLGYDITEAGVTSLEYLSFDGSDDTMAATYGSTFSNLTRSAAYLANGSNFIVDDNDASNLGSLLAITDGDLRYYRTQGLTATGGWNWGTNEFAIVTHSTAGEAEISGSGTPASRTGLGLPDVNGLRLGAPGANTTSRLNGHIYAVVDLNRLVTADERTNLQVYLAARSGVTL